MISYANARAYIFINGDEENIEDILASAETAVAEAWARSSFNEEKLPLEEVIANAHCTDWLVYASDEEKEQLLKLVDYEGKA